MREIALQDIESIKKIAVSAGVKADELDEVTGEVLLAVCYNYARAEEIENYSGWLFTVIKNCTNKLRREKNKREGLFCDFEECDVKSQANGAFFTCKSDIIESKVKDSAMEKALSYMDEVSKSILEMYYLYEYSLNEIATMLGLNVNTVKTRKNRAESQLKKYIDEGGIVHEY